MKYKVGQTVKIVECESGDHTGKEGRILKVNDKFYHVDYLGNGIQAYTCSAWEVELVNPTPSRYTGELKVGMRVWVVDTDPKYSDFTGERTVYKENNQWVLRVGSSNHQEYEQRGNGEWWSPGGCFYISHVISEPEEKDEISNLCGVRFIETCNLHFNNSPDKGAKKPMLKKATNFISSLQQPRQDYIRLGWIELKDDDYVVTEEGAKAMQRFAFGLADAKDLAEYAKLEVKRIEKEEKKK